MTSRRSDDSPTTDDWLAQRNGEYYDSIWPVDSQGRRIPPSTQITVIPSASILDTARAAQAANRERLDRRDNNLLIEKEAVRRIKKDREKEQKDEEGKIISRGVTEGSYYTVLPKRKFGGFAWIVQEHLGEFHDNPTTILDATDVVFGSLKLQKTLFQQYRLYTPLIYFQPFALPAQYTTYDVAVPTKDNSDPLPIKCTVLSETKNSVTLRFAGEITSPGTPSNPVETVTHTEYLADNYDASWLAGAGYTGDEFNNTTITRSIISVANIGLVGQPSFQKYKYIEHSTTNTKPQDSEFRREAYFPQVGIFFGKTSLSKPSYIYIFHKKNSNTSSNQLFGDGGVLLSELSPTTTYPPASIVEPGNLDEVSVDVQEITPTSKNAMSSLLKDIYNNTVQLRTFESGRVGNFTIAGGVIKSGYEGSTITEANYDTTAYYAAVYKHVLAYYGPGPFPGVLFPPDPFDKYVVPGSQTIEYEQISAETYYLILDNPSSQWPEQYRPILPSGFPVPKYPESAPVGVPIPYNTQVFTVSNWQRKKTTTYSPTILTFDETLEVIVTEKNFGPLE